MSKKCFELSRTCILRKFMDGIRFEFDFGGCGGNVSLSPDKVDELKCWLEEATRPERYYIPERHQKGFITIWDRDRCIPVVDFFSDNVKYDFDAEVEARRLCNRLNQEDREEGC